MSLRRIVLVASVILLTTITIIPQYRYYNINGHRKRMTLKEYRMERRKQAIIYAQDRELNHMDAEGYFRKQSDLDERIKKLQDEIANLKNEKTELKKNYLKTLDERIKQKDADIETLKKERSEVQASKNKVKEIKQQKKSAKLDDAIKATDQEAMELKKAKEQVDSVKTE